MDKTDKKAFGKRLKDARVKAGFKNQAELADRLNVSTQTVSSYESGGKLPTLETAILLAEALGISIDWLLDIDKPTSHHLTKGDFARWLDDMELFDVLTYFTEEVCDPYAESKYDAATSTILCYRIVDEDIAKYVKDRQTMSSLMKGKTIDSNLYSDWRNGKLRELDNKPALIDFEELDESDGQLPF